MSVLTWLGIGLCLSQSAAFSGLNLAVFSPSRLWLETAARSGDLRARRVLDLRRDANFTLATILIGNVAVNVLLTLLADSLLTGLAAFLFSTVVITLLGEIVPQAYLSRHALQMVAWLSPMLRAYQVLLWPVTKPLGLMLDSWVGPEGILWFREAELGDVLRYHALEATSDVSELEATGAINFLALDDLPAGLEGEPISPASILSLPFAHGRPAFPAFEASATDPFLETLQASGKKWVVLTDQAHEPRLVLNVDAFLREVLFSGAARSPAEHCHRPLVVRDEGEPLGHVLGQLTVQPERPDDDVVDHDLILVWTPTLRRIITGADILGRLLRGIARVTPAEGPAGRRRRASATRTGGPAGRPGT